MMAKLASYGLVLSSILISILIVFTFTVPVVAGSPVSQIELGGWKKQFIGEFSGTLFEDSGFKRHEESWGIYPSLLGLSGSARGKVEVGVYYDIALRYHFKLFKFSRWFNPSAAIAGSNFPYMTKIEPGEFKFYLDLMVKPSAKLSVNSDIRALGWELTLVDKTWLWEETVVDIENKEINLFGAAIPLGEVFQSPKFGVGAEIGPNIDIGAFKAVLCASADFWFQVGLQTSLTANQEIVGPATFKDGLKTRSITYEGYDVLKESHVSVPGGSAGKTITVTTKDFTYTLIPTVTLGVDVAGRAGVEVDAGLLGKWGCIAELPWHASWPFPVAIPAFTIRDSVADEIEVLPSAGNKAVVRTLDVSGALFEANWERTFDWGIFRFRPYARGSLSLDATGNLYAHYPENIEHGKPFDVTLGLDADPTDNPMDASLVFGADLDLLVPGSIRSMVLPGLIPEKIDLWHSEVNLANYVGKFNQVLSHLAVSVEKDFRVSGIQFSVKGSITPSVTGLDKLKFTRSADGLFGSWETTPFLVVEGDLTLRVQYPLLPAGIFAVYVFAEIPIEFELQGLFKFNSSLSGEFEVPGATPEGLTWSRSGDRITLTATTRTFPDKQIEAVLKNVRYTTDLKLTGRFVPKLATLGPLLSFVAPSVYTFDLDILIVSDKQLSVPQVSFPMRILQPDADIMEGFGSYGDSSKRNTFGFTEEVTVKVPVKNTGEIGLDQLKIFIEILDANRNLLASLPTATESNLAVGDVREVVRSFRPSQILSQYRNLAKVRARVEYPEPTGALVLAENEFTILFVIPDLRVTDLGWSPSGPMLPRLGDMVTFTATIKNEGDGDAGPSYLYFYIDNEKIAEKYVDNVAKGASVTKSFSWRATAVGPHTIKAKADATNLLMELHENNNELEKTFRVYAPDLVVTDLSWQPSDPEAAQDNHSFMTLTATIKNQGDTDAGEFYTEWRIDGVPLTENAIGLYIENFISSIPVGQTRTVSLSWLPTPGPHTVEVLADATGLLEESDEGNNARSENFYVRAPDLIVSSISWYPKVPQEGQEVKFWVKIMNQGDARSPCTFVAFYHIPPEGIAQYDNDNAVGSIDRGDSVEVTFTWKAKLARAVKFVVDDIDLVTEHIELNNDLTKRIKITPPMAEIIVLTWAHTTRADFESGSRVNLNTSSWPGDVILATSKPIEPRPETQENILTPPDVAGAGVLVTDGATLYVKRWGDHRGIDNFTVVGTGYLESEGGRNYGTFKTASAQSLSAAYLRDFIYVPIANNPYRIQKIDSLTEEISVENVPAGLLKRDTGLVEGYGWSAARGKDTDGHYLITSDGFHFYNLAYSRNNGGFNGFTVMVFDSNWNVIGKFTSGTSSYYTGGLLCDGEYVYPIEWTGKNLARITRIRLSDGSWQGQWTINQGEGMINGQYDWVNNKVWLGALEAGRVYRYRGKEFVTSGTLTSSVFDAGAVVDWGLLDWTSTKPDGTSVTVQIRGSVDGVEWSDWRTYDNGQRLGLSARYLQYSVTLSTTDPSITPVLHDIKMRYKAWAPALAPLFDTDKDNYEVGEKVTITLPVKNTGEGPLNIDVSLGIYDNEGKVAGWKEVKKMEFDLERFKILARPLKRELISRFELTSNLGVQLGLISTVFGGSSSSGENSNGESGNPNDLLIGEYELELYSPLITNLRATFNRMSPSIQSESLIMAGNLKIFRDKIVSLEMSPQRPVWKFENVFLQPGELKVFEKKWDPWFTPPGKYSVKAEIKHVFTGRVLDAETTDFWIKLTTPVETEVRENYSAEFKRTVGMVSSSGSGEVNLNNLAVLPARDIALTLLKDNLEETLSLTLPKGWSTQYTYTFENALELWITETWQNLTLKTHLDGLLAYGRIPREVYETLLSRNRVLYGVNNQLEVKVRVKNLSPHVIRDVRWVPRESLATWSSQPPLSSINPGEENEITYEGTLPASAIPDPFKNNIDIVKLASIVCIVDKSLAGVEVVDVRGDTATWIQTTKTDFEQGLLKNVEVVSEIKLLISPIVKMDGRIGLGTIKIIYPGLEVGPPAKVILSRSTPQTYYSSGTLTSPVFDAGSVVDWGSIDWTSTEPAGTSITIRTRTSNDRANWSAWQTCSPKGKIPSPEAKYLQYRATLSTTDQSITPELHRIAIKAVPRFYLVRPSPATYEANVDISLTDGILENVILTKPVGVRAVAFENVVAVYDQSGELMSVETSGTLTLVNEEPFGIPNVVSVDLENVDATSLTENRLRSDNLPPGDTKLATYTIDRNPELVIGENWKNLTVPEYIENLRTLGLISERDENLAFESHRIVYGIPNELEFIIELKNVSNTAINDLTISDPLPDILSYVKVEPSDVTYDAFTDTLTIPVVPASGTLTITLKGTIPETVFVNPDVDHIKLSKSTKVACSKAETLSGMSVTDVRVRNGEFYFIEYTPVSMTYTSLTLVDNTLDKLALIKPLRIKALVSETIQADYSEASELIRSEARGELLLINEEPHVISTLVLLSEEFDNAERWAPISGAWEVVDGTYHGRGETRTAGRSLLGQMGATGWIWAFAWGTLLSWGMLKRKRFLGAMFLIGIITGVIVYLALPKPIRWNMALAGEEGWADYEVEAGINVSSGFAGICFRKAGMDESSWIFYMDPGKDRVGIWNPIDRDVQIVSFAHDYDTWYSVKVVVLGQNIKTYINGEPLHDYTDHLGRYPSGKIGLAVSDGALAYFDNVTVSSIRVAIDLADLDLTDLKSPIAMLNMDPGTNKIVEYSIDKRPELTVSENWYNLTLENSKALLFNTSNELEFRLMLTNAIDENILVKIIDPLPPLLENVLMKSPIERSYDPEQTLMVEVLAGGSVEVVLQGVLPATAVADPTATHISLAKETVLSFVRTGSLSGARIVDISSGDPYLLLKEPITYQIQNVLRLIDATLDQVPIFR